jgi:hypothetical protein
MSSGRMKTHGTTRRHRRPAAGFALLVTLVVLIVLTTLTAGLATRLTMARRRQQYMIEYQRARYGLDSGLKFIFTEMPLLDFPLVTRQGQPDFSDLFWMDQTDYTDMIAEWAVTADESQIEAVLKDGAGLYEPEPVDMGSLMSKLSGLFGGGDDDDDAADANGLTPMPAASQTDAADEAADFFELDPNDVAVAGPYGVPWPQVIEPMEMEVGRCEVTITIEDENAKLPLSWLVTPYQENDDRPVNYALQTFLEWMAEDSQERTELEQLLKDDLKEIYGKKRFQLNAGDILLKQTRAVATNYRTVRVRDPKTGKITTKRIPIATSAQRAPATTTVTEKRPAVGHRADFAKLFHSSLLRQAPLAVPRTDRGVNGRTETVLDYLGLWGSQRVNVNTAPRHVLEATFSMVMTSSDAVNVAHDVIVQRQEKPFDKIDEIKDLGMLNTEIFNRLKNYITTTSTFFKVRIESRSGNAAAAAVAAIVKEGAEAEMLVVLYE